ncbi:LysE family translocator [Pseudarthrobacter sp. DSP2-3-2b1]|uniref:LysE family translocator n=1 Tax=Pseudarthrobacter sp. DSP2-3-2b1 TaxID=2804661 RepID=UPI003CF09E90
MAQSTVLFSVIKCAGAGYLVYLSVQAIRHRGGRTTTAAGPVPPSSTWRVLGEGFLVGATYLTSTVFVVAVLPQFVDYRAGSLPLAPPAES